MEGVSKTASFSAGVALALMSTLLIGSGFIFKKRALLRSEAHGKRARDGGLVYLRDWLWWLGLSMFALGEFANFIAYALAPAAVVTPLGGLSVLVSAVLSARFLEESLNVNGKLGCFICLLGSTLVVLHAPKEQVVNSLFEIREKFFDKPFLIYGLLVLLLSLALICFLGPRFGKTNPLVYVLISAGLGSISVMACKGLGIAIGEMIAGSPSQILSSWFFWLLLVLLILGVSIQLYYLNRALDLFNTGLITALLYVFFTGLVLTASAILFREWVTLTLLDYVELLFGLVLITLGVFMMTLLKDVNGDLGPLPYLKGPVSTTRCGIKRVNHAATRHNRTGRLRAQKPVQKDGSFSSSSVSTEFCGLLVSTTSDSHSLSTDSETEQAVLHSSSRLRLSDDSQQCSSDLKLHTVNYVV
ncbi:hypothetical protein P879_00582 [Paragonimus westermani]|uniref:Magnesium transporter NIPA2 n=1 Tax=Paragonimus westermani TaxID=34504 RepID=A0A8T0DTH1_9TREM|nr:hypothetical protein P879_00582 [Paragonimus westermani]